MQKGGNTGLGTRSLLSVSGVTTRISRGFQASRMGNLKGLHFQEVEKRISRAWVPGHPRASGRCLLTLIKEDENVPLRAVS